MNKKTDGSAGIELEKKALEIFSARFVEKADAKKHQLSISREIIKEGARIDLAVVYKHKYTIGFVEVKPDLTIYKSGISLYFLQLQNIAEKTGAFFVVITDTREYVLWTIESAGSVILNSIDDLYKLVIIDRVKLANNQLLEISAIMYDQFKQDKLLNNILLDKKIGNSKAFSAYLDYNQFVNVVMLNKTLEEDIFASILPDIDSKTLIYRYTSLSYLFDMIKENKYYLNCIVAMNDKTEIDYIGKYMDGIKVSNTENDEDQIINANKRFISCFSSKPDNLTLWRLYTNDADGVCLQYSIKSSNSNPNSYIKEVQYAVNNEATQFEDEHLHLDVFRNIRFILREERKVSFRFHSLYIWKHFFKPSAFSDETEIRLLIYNRKLLTPRKWRLNSSSGIVNSYIEYELFDDAMPITLEKIILGPKVPESEVNKVQLKQFMDSQKIRKVKDPNTGQGKDLYDDNAKKLLSKVKVERSKIQYYR